MNLYCGIVIFDRDNNNNKIYESISNTNRYDIYSSPIVLFDNYPPESDEPHLIFFEPSRSNVFRYKLRNNCKSDFNQFTGRSEFQFADPPHNVILSFRDKYHIWRFNKLKEYVLQGRTLPTITCHEFITSLHLEGQDITELPHELGQFRLECINLRKNRLGSKPPSSLSWLDGEPLQKSLTHLILSDNGLRYFPRGLTQCHKLIKLCLDRNALVNIPFAIQHMKGLKYLDLEQNQLQSVPISLAITNVIQVFRRNAVAAALVGRRKRSVTSVQLAQRLQLMRRPRMRSLVETAAGVVMRNSLGTTTATLPADLHYMLADWPLCVCGKFCDTPDVMLLSLQYPKKRALVLHQAAFCSQECSEYCCMKLYGRSYTGYKLVLDIQQKQ